MRTQIVNCTLLVFSVYSSNSCAADESAAEHFENYIRPVLVETCFRCHGDSKTGGHLRVDSREALLQGGESGPAIIPGNSGDSLLIKAISRHDDVSAMPPEKDKALRADQIAAFETWIRDGATWPVSSGKFEGKVHWAFQPVADPPIPVVRNSAWPKSTIDHFILSAQEDAGIAPSPMADKRALIRRATLDLTGLPPTPEEVDAFVTDASPDAFEKVVDRLLASPHYGERWGRHWLDVVRYADTAGETADFPVPLAWKYRNYVIDAFNSDKPYDEFLMEQIAGDVLANQQLTDDYAEMVTATGYLAISRRFGFDSENYHHLTIQDTIDTLGQSLMGLSLGCARCHDHKFDAITTTDYYGLYGIFDSSRYAFPGSEQKQKYRSMVPLLPPGEAVPLWRAFDQEVAIIATSLEAQNKPVPSAILRSLNDMDGDFEMQAPAAGGSNGVLVPPWLYEGQIAVTNAAQSPFRNLYGRGRVGASITTEAGPYRIAQSLYPRRSLSNCNVVYTNLDFRITGNSELTGFHRVELGDSFEAPLVEVKIDGTAVTLCSGAHQANLGGVVPGEWHNLQLMIDLRDSQVSGRLVKASSFSDNSLGAVVYADRSDAIPLSTGSALTEPPTAASGPAVSVIVLKRSADVAAPSIEFDNLGVQEMPIPAGSLQLPSSNDGPTEAELLEQLQHLVGIGGHYELQVADTSPASPWNAGPNSVVKVASRSQSPFRNQFAVGTKGVFMPNRGEYDGFGLTLPAQYKFDQTLPGSTLVLHACFDFQCSDVGNGGDGSWRFYLGHGPGNSAAIELFINGAQFFRRSGDAREVVTSLLVGQWYQVQMTLNLTTRTFEGSITSKESRTEFSGDVAAGWDGIVDYSFIDSYGHIGGVRPALDVDNYDVRTTALTPFDSPTLQESSAADDEALAKAKDIQKQLAKLSKSNDQINRLLEEGPFPMTYGMAEGTPHSVRIHLRGEPSQLGDLVSRSFVKVLNGRTLDDNEPGSGRLELAEWLTSTDHPLTARVMVNRLWQYHFGRGLVRTPNDFGVRGIPPTHPELLDHLATQFIRSGWSIKSMHRLMMLSATYQQSAMQAKESADAEHQDLYARFLRRRLSAEEIRDAILFVSQELDPSPGQGHPFPSAVSWGFTQHGPFTAVYDHNKRSVYLMTQRLKRHPFLALFDGPDPNASTADRLGTTVPTQALFFLNDSFVHRTSQMWAQRLLATESSRQAVLRRCLNEAFGREPTDQEVRDAEQFWDTYEAELQTDSRDVAESARRMALAAYLRTLIGSNEFLHVD